MVTIRQLEEKDCASLARLYQSLFTVHDIFSLEVDKIVEYLVGSQAKALEKGGELSCCN